MPAELKGRLEALSVSTGRPESFYVREAVAEHLDELEWAYGVANLAEGIRAGRVQTRPLDGLTRELGFDPDVLRSERDKDASA